MFVDFLDAKGIKHMVSCPYTHQQNGFAERKHRHVEITVTLMTKASLPVQFWLHAYSHAAFLINKMPCRVLNMKSPYLMVIGQKSDIQNLNALVLQFIHS